jgi:hypothetical protein
LRESGARDEQSGSDRGDEKLHGQLPDDWERTTAVCAMNRT